jgi:hypothetical protein
MTDAGIGYTSAPTLLIGSAPSIVFQPQSVTVHAGDNASFNVTAVADFTPVSYQWSFTGTAISGATSSSLTRSNVTQADLGSYAVAITNAFGGTNSSAAILSMYPFLVVPFKGVVVIWGKDTTLSVQAWGTGPLSYQWFQNGAAIQDATNQDLTLTSVQFTNAGLYWVVVSNPLGSVTNTPAQVVVNPAGVSLGLSPTITIEGVVGYSYIIQRTADLTDTNSWLTLTNITLSQPAQIWVDTSADASLPTHPQHFYRVLPGP